MVVLDLPRLQPAGLAVVAHPTEGATPLPPTHPARMSSQNKMSRLFSPEWEPEDNDNCYTPPFIFDRLGLTFDLDPAAPPGGVPWVPARCYYTEFDNGLLQPWFGVVWLNPPYSKPAPWVDKLSAHGNGIALLPLDPTTKWFRQNVASADLHCFLEHRIRFRRPTPQNETSARFPSVLAAYGPEATAALRQSDLGWLVKSINRRRNT